MRRRRRSRIRSLVLTGVLVVLWWVLLAPPALGGRTSYINVNGHSMEPTYFTGDLVLVRKATNYHAGDIVAFHAQNGIVIHRVKAGDGVAGYETQGDNNSWVDPWRPTNGEVVGKAWFRLPGASRWLMLLTQPIALAVLVTAVLALTMRPNEKESRPRKASAPGAPAQPAAAPKPATTRRGMQLDELSRAVAAIPRRTRAVSTALVIVAVVVAIPAALAWLDAPQRTSFHETGHYAHSADYTYTFRVEPTTLYPDGVVGPIDAKSSAPPKVFAKPARVLDVSLDYRFDASGGAKPSGTYAINAILSAEAGWQTSLRLTEPEAITGNTAHAEFPIDLATVRDIVTRVAEESGLTPGPFTMTIQPTFDVRTNVVGNAINDQYRPELTVKFTGNTWDVAPNLHAEQPRRLGSNVTQDVELAGVRVTTVRLLVFPAVALLAAAALLVWTALRRSPSFTVDALLRRPGIAVIDLERPPADADLALPLTSPEGIRRIAERDGGLVLRYEHNGETLLYARHENRVYCYTVEDAHRSRAASDSCSRC
jgi:signal peptidase